jgi:hypothetical protein
MSGICARCEALLEAGERFCTQCGAEVEREPDVPSALPEPSPTPRWPRRARVVLAALAGALVLATGAAIFLGLELSTTIDEKEQTEAWLATTEAELEQTEVRLRESESLSSRRKAVLKQTDRVLSQVDPLLTSVDRMKQITNRMTDTQESFASNATLVISSLATLLDYVVDVDPLYWDISYIYALLDDVRSGASAASSDQDRFGSLERQYQTASRAFGTRATRYVGAVERLQRQLTRVTE